MSTSGIHWEPVIRLFDAMKELAAVLHTAAHSGPMKDCPDPNCQRFKDDE